MLSLDNAVIKPAGLTISYSPGATLLAETSGPGEFEELCWHYLHSFPLNVQLGQIKTRFVSEAEETEARAEGPGGGLRLEFDSRLFCDGQAIGQLMLSLYRRPGGGPDEVYLELEQGQIWLPELRGQGLGRVMVENVVALGRALGVKAVTLFAMYDGRFAWPALGFRFGDYSQQPGQAKFYRRAFRAYCQRQGIIPPDTRGWDAPQFARFVSQSSVLALVGHRNDPPSRQMVELGRAFMLSRRPFFLCFPLS